VVVFALVATVAGLALVATQLGRRPPEGRRTPRAATRHADALVPTPAGALDVTVRAVCGSVAGADGGSTPDAGADAASEITRTSDEPVREARLALLDAAGTTLAEGLTDASGRARLERLPDGSFTLVVSQPGYARSVVIARVESGTGAVDVALTAGATLRGRVVDEVGIDVPDARITVTLDDASLDAAPSAPGFTPPWVVQSDRRGSFTIDTIESGLALRLEATADGFETTTRRAVVPRADAPPVQVVLRRTGILTGRVVGPDGQPTRATVILAGSGVWPPRAVETDAAGDYRIAGVPGGVYELRARSGALVAEPQEGVDLEPGGTREVALRLGPGAMLRAEVRDADADAPLGEAEIVVTEDGLSFAPQVARTSVDGTGTVEGLRAVPHRCAVRAPGFVSVVAAACTPGESVARFALRRAAEIRGVVVDAAGAPVRGAQVEVGGTTDAGEIVSMSAASLAFRASLFEAQRSGPAPLRPAGELGVTLGGVPPIPLAATVLAHDTPPGTVRAPASGTSDGGPEDPPTALGFATDAEGRFRITGVPPGRIALVARHLAYAPTFTAPRVVVAGARLEDVRIVLAEGGVVDGRVTDARGFPVEAIRVELSVPGEPVPRGLLAGSDGRFEFRGVVGEVTLTAFPPGAPPVRVSAQVASGATVPVTLALESELLALHGRVVDARGFPVAGARVRIRALRARTPFAQTTESADDGTWTVEGLPAPPWALEADHADYALAKLPAIADAREPVRVTLAACASVRGTVTDALSDASLPGVRVTLHGRDQSFDAVTLADGRWEIARVPEGRYVAEAAHADHVAARIDVTILQRGRALADVDDVALSLVPGGALRGEVVDALGAPVSGAEVAPGTADGSPDWSRAVRTDPRGGFVLRGVPAGDVWPSARHPAAGEAQSRWPTRVRTGEETPGVVLRLPERFDEARGDARLAGERDPRR
jgi:protocatechuate 3,4-dioxygenase beta subunit